MMDAGAEPFVRQFLVSDRPCAAPAGWTRTPMAGGTLDVHAHPALGVHVARGPGGEVALLGFAVDPAVPGRTDAGIAASLAQSPGREALAEALRGLGGRFVILLVTPAGGRYAFHDACGLRSLFHAAEPGRCLLASQPLLLGRCMELVPTEAQRELAGSRYAASDPEFWLPTTAELWRGVRQLLPNHYLDVEAGRAVRFWPNRPLEPRGVIPAAREAAALLQSLLTAMQARAPLALPLTAGLDSRILLGAARERAHELFAYTLLYRDLTAASADVAIPAAILARIGVPHHLIDCHAPADPAFAAAYRASVDLPHDDWCGIAWGMWRGYPRERVCLKGNGAEVARRFYPAADEPSLETLMRAEAGWRELPFARSLVEAWLRDAIPVCEAAGVDPLDLFYWEHRMGSWQARSQLEWDAVQEAFTPYDHRGLLELMLSASAGSRSGPRWTLQREVVRVLWPELLAFPVNPRRGMARVKGFIRDALVVTGAYRHLRRAAAFLRRARP